MAEAEKKRRRKQVLTTRSLGPKVPLPADSPVAWSKCSDAVKVAEVEAVEVVDLAQRDVLVLGDNRASCRQLKRSNELRNAEQKVIKGKQPLREVTPSLAKPKITTKDGVEKAAKEAVEVVDLAQRDVLVLGDNRASCKRVKRMSEASGEQKVIKGKQPLREVTSASSAAPVQPKETKKEGVEEAAKENTGSAPEEAQKEKIQQYLEKVIKEDEERLRAEEEKRREQQEKKEQRKQLRRELWAKYLREQQAKLADWQREEDDARRVREEDRVRRVAEEQERWMRKRLARRLWGEQVRRIQAEAWARREEEMWACLLREDAGWSLQAEEEAERLLREEQAQQLREKDLEDWVNHLLTSKVDDELEEWVIQLLQEEQTKWLREEQQQPEGQKEE